MKQKLLAIHGFAMGFIRVFNLGFFAISGTSWVVLSVQKMLAGVLDFGLLWSAFSDLYGQYSFKIGCVFLIIFNGLAAVQSFFQQYADMAERVEHGRGFWKKFLGGKS